jgi:hypothetical protein
MELLAVGGLAYLGTILNQHLLKEYTDEDDKKNKEKFAFVNPNDYKNEDLKNIAKKYQKKVDQIKQLSFIPDKTNVIPSFYNQMPGVGEEYTNQKIPIPGRLDNCKAPRELSSLDEQFQFGQIDKKDPVGMGCQIEVHQNWTPFADNNDMTYGIFKKDELQHNNMQPFHRRRDDVVENMEGKMIDDINANNNLTKMELFTGSSKNYFPKEAPPAFFPPMKDVRFVNGIPSTTDKSKDRYLPGIKRHGEKPFQPIQVQPGVALGYNEESKIGFHETYRAPEVNIDFQRVGNRIQKSYKGVMIPGLKGQKQPIDPNVAKRRPEKVWEISEYVRGGGNGGVTAPAVNPEQIAKDQKREFSMELKNGIGLASGSVVGPFNPDGKKRKPHKHQFDGYQSAGAGTGPDSRFNSNLPSFYLLDNQRTETGFNTYDGPLGGGDIKQVHQYNTQPSNTTLRQTTAETAQDGPAYGDVRQVHQYNTQPTNSNLRQTTAETAQDGPAYGDVRKGNQYNVQPTNTTLRQTTAETAQDGHAFGDIRKGTQFNTQPTNSNLRQTTAETAQDGVAYGDIRKGNQYNLQPTNTTLRQTTAETAQDGVAYGDIRKGTQFNTQPTNTTLRQTTAETANDGVVYGDTRKGNQFNTQPANTTLRQTTAETAQDGAAYGSVRKVNQFNTQPSNSTMRQSTAETAQDGVAYGSVRKVNQFNTQPSNSTMRQSTAETAQDGAAYGSVRKSNQFNTQPANSTYRQSTAETAQDGAPMHNVPKTTLFNTQPANSTIRQVVNYGDHTGPAIRSNTTELRSRSDANAMTTHSSREDTTEGRLMTYSGWNEGIGRRTHGLQNSKQKDITNNWTRVNPPSSGPRSNGMQDMDGFNLDEKIVYKLNKIKDYSSVGDRIETKVAEVLQNNELINNAFQKYGNKPDKIYPNIHDINPK